MRQDTIWLMSEIVLFAKIVAKPGSGDAMADALRELVAASAEEDGLRVYDAHREDDDPDVFWFYEAYDDEDALAVHARGPKMTEARGGIREHGAAPPEVHRVTRIAFKP